MNMGTAQVPTLSELEAEITRRGLRLDYASELMDASDAFTCADDDPKDWIASCVMDLTETQKVQAALKVLGVK